MRAVWFVDFEPYLKDPDGLAIAMHRAAMKEILSMRWGEGVNSEMKT